MTQLEKLETMIEEAENEIKRLPAGSQEQSRKIKDLRTLIETYQSVKKDEEARMDKEHDYFVASKKEEANKKADEEKRKLEKKDRTWTRIKDGVQIGATIATGIITAVFTWYGLKMEYNNGNATSFTLKNCLKDLTHRK